MVTIISFIVVLGVLIAVHEFGHFIVAKACGVGVLKFSIGFGPKIAGWKRGMTDYMISAIPLGGYVKMVGEEPDSKLDPDEIKYSFTHKKLWQKSLVVAAGPVFNFLLAIVLYFFLYWMSGAYYYSPVMGNIEDGSPAYEAGLKTGDLVKKIDEKNIKTWAEIETAIRKSDGKNLLFLIKRGHDEKEIVFVPRKLDSKDIFGDIKKIYKSGALPFFPPLIAGVGKDSPAKKAGLKKDDLILEINQTKIKTWNDISKTISSSKGEIELLIDRNGEVLKLRLTPELKEFSDPLGNKNKRRIIGIAGADVSKKRKIGPFEALKTSTIQTGKVIELTFLGIVKMVKGSVSKDTIGGPIMIAQMAGDQAKQGLTNLFAFMALISINLGLLNLLPVPVLDGGHLLFFLIEGITGKPVNMKIREISQQAGLFILLLLMGFAFYNDIVRLISG